MSVRSSSKLWKDVPDGMVLPLGCCSKLARVPRIPRGFFHFSASGTALEGGCDPTDDPHGVCCHSELCNGPGSPQCQCAVVGEHYFGAG